MEDKKLQWIECEEIRHYEGGAFLTFKGYKCPKCAFFRHRKRGKSRYCEDCGQALE